MLGTVQTNHPEKTLQSGKMAVSTKWKKAGTSVKGPEIKIAVKLICAANNIEQFLLVNELCMLR